MDVPHRPWAGFVAIVFVLLLGCAPRGAGDPSVSPPAEPPRLPRIVAFGDVHGDLAATQMALRMAGAIDDAGAWAGGGMILVQTGDQLDRGDDEPEILALFRNLKMQAARDGGRFVVLNGNHELMNVAGDFRYVTDEGFTDFGPEVTADDDGLAEIPVEHRARRVAFRPGGPYAKILASRPVVAVIGNNVFVHAGVLPDVADYGVERLNREAQEWLLGQRDEPPDVLLDSDGPVWSRHYSDDPDEEDCALLAEALGKLGATRMIVGHTISEAGIESRCDGQVWLIDVGMAAAYGGEPQVLVIEGDRVTTRSTPTR